MLKPYFYYSHRTFRAEGVVGNAIHKVSSDATCFQPPLTLDDVLGILGDRQHPEGIVGSVHGGTVVFPWDDDGLNAIHRLLSHLNAANRGEPWPPPEPCPEQESEPEPVTLPPEWQPVLDQLIEAIGGEGSHNKAAALLTIREARSASEEKGLPLTPSDALLPETFETLFERAIDYQIVIGLQHN